LAPGCWLRAALRGLTPRRLISETLKEARTVQSN
jgi:hypothetical protein